MFKGISNWIPQRYPIIIQNGHTIVRRSKTRLMGAIFRYGDVVLHDSLKHFIRSVDRWTQLTLEQKERHFSNLMNFSVAEEIQTITSADGTLTVPKSATKKKPGQQKSVRGTRTRTFKKKRNTKKGMNFLSIFE